MRIVEASDDPVIRETLTRLGFEVTSTAGGQDLVEAAFLIQPDLIIADLEMAGEFDGIDAVHVIRRHCEVPAILVTDRHDEETLERVQQAHIAVCLSKPVYPADLEAAVAQLVQRAWLNVT